MARRMKPGFNRDHKAIGRIMRSRRTQEFVHKVAAPGAERAGGFVEDYITDRAVSAVMVEAEDQAKDGAATKAAGELGWPLR